MSAQAKIGYIGVDVLNNATICNEAQALMQQEVPLDFVSVYKYDNATFYKNETVAKISEQLHYLYPMTWYSVLYALTVGPFLFGWNYWKTIFRACTCEAEGWYQRSRLIGHLLPSISLAIYWRKRGVTHIHAHWAHTATTMAMHASRLLGIQFSFTGHANDLFVHAVGLNEKIRSARFIICISEFHRQWYLERGATPDQLHVIYCGIDTNRFTPKDRNTKAFESDPPVILGVGRLVEKKGFHNLIQSCAILNKRGVSFRCLIAGNGPEEERLRNLVQENNLENIVHITGVHALQEDLPSILTSSEIFTLPCVRDSDGDMDGLPQVIMEAMACALPVVSTRLVGIPDIVRHEKTGLLVEPNDVLGLADTLADLLASTELQENLGRYGCNWVNAYFDREENVKHVGQLLTWAATHPGKSTPTWRFDGAPDAEKEYGGTTTNITECEKAPFIAA